MKNVILALGFGVLCLSAIVHASEDRPLLSEYRGRERIPDSLYETYAKIVKAMRDGSEKEIRAHCLPFVPEITREPRPKKTEEYGHDINLPIAKTRFHNKIFFIKKQSYGCYTIATQTSGFGFVETKDSGWKLYQYSDWPVQ
jgi:hypothetical protein